MTELIGFLAALCTTACYIPQAIHVIRTRNTQGISLFAYSILFCGISCWLLYGILLHDLPLMISNGISLPLLSIVLVIKIRGK